MTKDILKIDFKNASIKENLIILSQCYKELNQINNRTISKYKIFKITRLTKNYRQNLLLLMNNYLNNLLNTENGCVIAEFIMQYNCNLLNDEEIKKISTNLSQNKSKFLVLSEINQRISFIKEEYANFAIGEEKKMKLFIPTTKNELADILINTEIDKLIINHNIRQSKFKSKKLLSISSYKLGANFEINLSQN